MLMFHNLNFLPAVIVMLMIDDESKNQWVNLDHCWLWRCGGLVLNRMLAFNCWIHLLFYPILLSLGCFWVKFHLFWIVNFLRLSVLLCLFVLFHVFLLVASLNKFWQGKICTENGKRSPQTSFFIWDKFPFIFHTSDPVFFPLTWQCGAVENLKRFVGSIQLNPAFLLSLLVPWLCYVDPYFD